MCHAIQRYTKTSIKYMKNYDKYKESSYIQYLYANSVIHIEAIEILIGFKKLHRVIQFNQKS